MKEDIIKINDLNIIVSRNSEYRLDNYENILKEITYYLTKVYTINKDFLNNTTKISIEKLIHQAYYEGYNSYRILISNQCENIGGCYQKVLLSFKIIIVPNQCGQAMIVDMQIHNKEITEITLLFAMNLINISGYSSVYITENDNVMKRDIRELFSKHLDFLQTFVNRRTNRTITTYGKNLDNELIKY